MKKYVNGQYLDITEEDIALMKANQEPLLKNRHLTAEERMEQIEAALIELAAILILPCDDEDFITEMIKVLCGLNYNKWYIAEKLNIHK